MQASPRREGNFNWRGRGDWETLRDLNAKEAEERAREKVAFERIKEGGITRREGGVKGGGMEGGEALEKRETMKFFIQVLVESRRDSEVCWAYGWGPNSVVT